MRRIRSAATATAAVVLATALLADGLALGETAPADPPPSETASSTTAPSGAYGDQSDAEALATAREQFPALLDTPPLRWPLLPDGERISGYLDAQTAVVLEGTSRRGVLESSLPLRGETPSGTSAPIDLGLVDSGDGFSPKSAAADVEIPSNATDEVRFPEQDFGLSLAGAEPQEAAVRSNKAFFANVAEDADLVLEPLAAGAELSVVLRSPAASTSIPLDFDLAAGHALEFVGPTDDVPLPAGSVKLVDGEQLVAGVYPAAALDAAGEHVPVRYELAGSRLTMVVDTSDVNAWPVLVDPPIGVYDNNGTSVSSTSAGYTWPNWGPATYSGDTTTWSYCNNQASYPNKKFYLCQGTLAGASWSGGPLYAKANATQSYGAGDWAQWVKDARPDSYIYQFDAVALSNVGAAKAQLAVGVRNAAGTDWENGTVVWGNNFTGTGSTGDLPLGKAAYRTPLNTAISSATRYLKVHTGEPAPPTPITPGNRAVFRMVMTSGPPGSPLPYIAMGGGATYSSELHAPTLGTPSHTNPVPTGWVDSYSDTVSATATDRGLGMGKIVASGPGLAATAEACAQNGAPPNTSGANAQNYYDSCALSLTLPSTNYTAPEGINNYAITATDLVGNRSTAQDKTWQVKVDRGAPSVSLSGYLPENDGNALLDSTAPIDQGGHPYDLRVDATDASASGARSGVRSIEVKVDGVRKDYAEQACAAGSCPMARDWTFTPSQYPEGTRTIDAVVRDWAGNTATKTVTVIVDRTDEPSDLDATIPLPPPSPVLIPGLMECTTIIQPANYQYFSLGASFEGLPVTHSLRTCEQPDEEDGAVRSNDVTFIYGDCTIAEDDSGCAPPLQIQSWPACENSRADYRDGPDEDPVPREDLTIRGTSASVYDDGTSLEIYTGKTVIAIYGDTPAQTRRAADAVRAEPVSQAPIDGPTATNLGGNLAPPAVGSLEGTLACD